MKCDIAQIIDCEKKRVKFKDEYCKRITVWCIFSFVSKSSAQWMNIRRNSLQTNIGNKNTFYNLKYC